MTDRERLKPGTVISYAGIEAVVVNDTGGPTLSVRAEGDLMQWYWTCDGQTCKVVREPPLAPLTPEEIKAISDVQKLPWKVNTPAFLKEISLNPGTAILRIPIQILALLLGEVATRCSELNDTVLNGLMAQLALYDVTDPYSPRYDASVAEALIEAKERLIKSNPKE